MTVGGALTRASTMQGLRFVVKGGVALEMRFGGRGRATEDLDVISLGDGADLGAAVDRALAMPYGDWTFKVREQMVPLGPHGVRIRVQLAYRGEHWATVQVDIARPDGTEAETERLPGISLAPFGLEGPHEMECLSLRFQIAQKFHGLTRGVVLATDVGLAITALDAAERALQAFLADLLAA